VAEGIAGSFTACGQQVGNPFAAPQQRFEQAFQLISVVLYPRRRNLAQGFVEYLGREVQDAIDPGFEGADRAHAIIDDAPWIKTGDSGIGQVPMGTVERESVIDHQRNKTEFTRWNSGTGEPVFQLCAKKDRLAAVSVGDPSIECEDGEELFGICDLVEQHVRNEIVDRHVIGVARVTGAEVPARVDPDASRTGLQIDLRIGRNEFGGQDDDLMPGAGNLQMGENFRREEFVDKNPPMLRVILELDDVEVAVVGLQQVRLCAASHLADEPARIYGHTVFWSRATDLRPARLFFWSRATDLRPARLFF
jgi:hypothetical protein